MRGVVVAQRARLHLPSDVDALAVVARSVAAAGVAGVPHALAALGSALGGAAAVRLSGHPSAAMPSGAVLDVPLRAAGATYGVLRVVTPMPIDASGAMLASVAADVIATAYAADARDAGMAMLDLEADLADVAAALHDSVGQALVAARYAADLATLGRLPVSAVPQAVQAALGALRGVLHDLGPCPPDGRLGAALRGLAGTRTGTDDGEGRESVRVVVRADDPALDHVPAPVSVFALRLVRAALVRPPGNVHVVAAVAGGLLKLEVRCADNPYDASGLERWARRASALGGTLERHDHGVLLAVPATEAVGGP